ncbi:MAG TPA: AI-2E family transporter [Cyclobacteriaceae bacterium]|jgi:predicted PurR-regulated permease PerM|nr:AI-2E family transporter [Cyclobacteriaceae bacterium]
MDISVAKLDGIFKTLIIFVIVITGAVLLKDITVPIVFAALFSVMMLPIVKRLQKKVGRISAILIVLSASLMLIALMMWFVISQLASLVASLPDLEEKFTAFVLSLSTTINANLQISTVEQTQLLKDVIRHFSSYVADLLLSTSYFVYFFIQVPIYIFLFLLYRERFKDFLRALTPNSDLKWKDEIQGVVRGYISGLSLVVLIAAILNSTGLLILGIKHAIFFGFLSGMLTMIPYVGISIGASLPAIFALLTKDSAWYALGVIGVHAFVQFLEANFITPKITGSRISINAFAAIIALLIGGKIWGIAGMILAVPLIGVFKILISYSPSLKPLVILLGDENSKGIPENK